MRTWQRYWVWGLLAIAIGLSVFGLCALSPALWDTALLAGWDAGVIAWLILTFAAIGRADAQCTWEQAQALEPHTLYMLVVVIITSIVGLRRMTLLHAIISFGFVLIILSYAVNAIGNAI